MDLKKKERKLRIISITLYSLIVLTLINTITWIVVADFSHPTNLVFTYEIVIILLSFAILMTIVVILAIASVKQKNMADEFNILLEKKEYSQIEDFFKKKRERTLSLSLFRNYTFYIGYSYMFLEKPDLAYKELSYFLRKSKINDYLLHLSAIYYLYIICLINNNSKDISKIVDLYNILIDKKFFRKDKNVIILRIKTCFNYLIGGKITQGMEPLVKAECPLVTNYLSNIKGYNTL